MDLPASTSPARALSEPIAGRIRSVLDAYHPKQVHVPERRKAAVLIPLFDRGGEPWVVLTRRTEHVSTHKGQISFPGGSQDAGDADLWATAVRETVEELGADAAAIQRLGALDDYPTYSSGFIVTAFVGNIAPPPDWSHHEAEVAEVIELPLRTLLEVGKTETWEHDGIRFPMHIFEAEGHYIWGLTAFILDRFLGIVGEALVSD